MNLDAVFGKIENCWDCNKPFRAKHHHYQFSNGKIVPICNHCIFHRDINKLKKMEE